MRTASLVTLIASAATVSSFVVPAQELQQAVLSVSDDDFNVIYLDPQMTQDDESYGSTQPVIEDEVMQWETPVEEEELYLLEFEDGTRHWVMEDYKWQLRSAGINFMDVTNNQELGMNHIHSNVVTVEYPEKPAQNKSIQPLFKALSKDSMHANLEKFTSFHTRYYKSDYGKQSSNWLFEQVKGVIAKSGAGENGAFARQFDHPWGQASIIAQIPGKTNKTVVVGAHQDSINLFLPSLLAAPGADDDGSGTVTIFEAFKAILSSPEVVQGKAENTLEFHWYSAEEGGLLGSQAIFQDYERRGRDVKAMLQQDMTGYVQGTLDAGKPESVGVITDYVDEGLTEFIKTVVTNYCDIPYVETKCGYACSDHASASKAGYPSAFVIESDFSLSDHKIHTTEDKLEYLSFDHMLQHAKLTLAFAYELAFAKL